jgi:hypothetical protein
MDEPNLDEDHYAVFRQADPLYQRGFVAGVAFVLKQMTDDPTITIAQMEGIMARLADAR